MELKEIKEGEGFLCTSSKEMLILCKRLEAAGYPIYSGTYFNEHMTSNSLSLCWSNDKLVGCSGSTLSIRLNINIFLNQSEETWLLEEANRRFPIGSQFICNLGAYNGDNKITTRRGKLGINGKTISEPCEPYIYYHGEWAELVEEKAQVYKFKVGQKVKIVKGGHGVNPNEVGKITTILKLGKYGKNPGYLISDDINSNSKNIYLHNENQKTCDEVSFEAITNSSLFLTNIEPKTIPQNIELKPRKKKRLHLVADSMKEFI
jgi:hypothetical protein